MFSIYNYNKTNVNKDVYHINVAFLGLLGMLQQYNFLFQAYPIGLVSTDLILVKSYDYIIIDS